MYVVECVEVHRELFFLYGQGVCNSYVWLCVVVLGMGRLGCAVVLLLLAATAGVEGEFQHLLIKDC